MQKDIEKIKAGKDKISAELKQQTKTMVQKIRADTDVKYNEIVAEARLIETDIITKARQEAARIKAEADSYYLTTVSNA